MKIKLLVLLISLATIFISLFKGRNAVLSLNLEAEKLHQFSELLPRYMVLPFMYDIKINMLGEKDTISRVFRSLRALPVAEFNCFNNNNCNIYFGSYF